MKYKSYKNIILACVAATLMTACVDAPSIDSVTWENGQVMDDTPVISFNMSDGSVQAFEAYGSYSITETKMMDLDNDGEDDYIVLGYFANTAAEYQQVYAFRYVDGKVEQFFPVSGIDGVDDNNGYDCQFKEVTLYQSDSEVVNGLELTSYGKIDAKAYVDTERTIYYKDGGWKLYSSYDNIYGAYETYTEPKAIGEVDMDEESSRLYEGFMEGTEAAIFDANGDCGQYIALSDALTDGESYTLNEIIELLTAQGQYAEGYTVQKTRESLVDCGLDGNIEILVHVDFDTEFSFDMVVKNVDGSLVIGFFADSWSRSETHVLYNGAVTSYGSSGANSHGGENGFINADGKYVLWYNIGEDANESHDGEATLSFYEDGEYKNASFELPDGYYVYEERISYDRDGKDKYYYFIVFDEEFNEIPADPSDPDDIYTVIRKEVSGLGYTVVDEAESEVLLEERRKDIGYTDDIYNFGRQYLPEGN